MIHKRERLSDDDSLPTEWTPELMIYDDDEDGIDGLMSFVPFKLSDEFNRPLKVGSLSDDVRDMHARPRWLFAGNPAEYRFGTDAPFGYGGVWEFDPWAVFGVQPTDSEPDGATETTDESGTHADRTADARESSPDLPGPSSQEPTTPPRRTKRARDKIGGSVSSTAKSPEHKRPRAPSNVLKGLYTDGCMLSAVVDCEC